MGEFSRVNYRFRHYVRNSRAQYEQQLIDEYRSSPKLFHSIIRNKKKGQMSVDPLKKPSGQLVCDCGEVANYLADTFASVYISDTPAYPAQNQVYNGSMPDVFITAGRVIS